MKVWINVFDCFRFAHEKEYEGDFTLLVTGRRKVIRWDRPFKQEFR